MRDAEDNGENRTGIAAIRALLLTGCRRNEIWPYHGYGLTPRRDASASRTRKAGRSFGRSALPLPSTWPRKRGRKPPGGSPADRGDGHFIGLPRVLARICARAGLEDVTLHGLRHTFAAAAAELGFSELTIAGLLGHSVPGVTARYAHLAPDGALVVAADRVSARIAAALDGHATAEVVPLRHPA